LTVRVLGLGSARRTPNWRRPTSLSADTLRSGRRRTRVSTLSDTVGESFELNVAAAQEAGTLIKTAGPIILAQGSVRTKWNYSHSRTTHAGSIFPACPASICLKWFANSIIIGPQEYGRIYLKKGMSFGLRKRGFLKALDGICLRATLSLS
jgi:hypothetical protein